jgi:hypothetical protein
VVDLLIFPSYIDGNIPPSHKSNITWPNYPRPPKTFWRLWSTFLQCHITPFLQSQAITWNTNHNWRNSPVFFKRRYSHPLYKLLDDDPTLCKLNRKATTRFDAVYIVAPFYTDLSLSSNDFTPVDIHKHNTGLSIVGDFLGINDIDSPPHWYTYFTSS